jgi:two-component system response regulator
LHRTYICDVERGARNVTLLSIEKLAGALEISVSTLLAYAREPLPEGTRMEEFVTGQMHGAPTRAAHSSEGTRVEEFVTGRMRGAPTRAAHSPEGTRAEEFAAGGLVDILYVEDNPADIGLATEGLKNITNRIYVARDGQAALNFLFGTGEYANRKTTSHPQLILLDLGLPKVDGLEVLRRVKADPRTSGIPVIVLTASVRDRDLQTSKRLGAEAYIIKPLDLQNLSRVTPQLHLQWALLKPAAPVQQRHKGPELQ